jgi:hypothetical protein
VFRTYPITDEIREKEKDWSGFTGNQFSIRTDGGNRVAGNYAEIVFQKMYPHALRISDVDQNADFVLRGKRIDVKTKVRTVPAQPHYEASVELRQADFDVDFYCFFSFNRIAQIMEYCGWISKQELHKVANKVKQGQVDKRNEWTQSVASFQITYDKLHYS